MPTRCKLRTPQVKPNSRQCHQKEGGHWRGSHVGLGWAHQLSLCSSGSPPGTGTPAPRRGSEGREYSEQASGDHDHSGRDVSAEKGQQSTLPAHIYLFVCPQSWGPSAHAPSPHRFPIRVACLPLKVCMRQAPAGLGSTSFCPASPGSSVDQLSA